MSNIEGLDALKDKLGSFEGHYKSFMNERLEAAVLELQRDTAARVPVDTGQGRDTILMPDAIRRDGAGTPNPRWTFGFLTDAMKKRAYYLFWVEFGTKAYRKGEKRVAGRTRAAAGVRPRHLLEEYGIGQAYGRAVKYKKLRRDVPARPAQPFFRPAAADFMVRLRQTRTLAEIYATAMTAAGFKR